MTAQLALFDAGAPRALTRPVTRWARVAAPAPRPWPAVVLAVDPGNTSGWAIYVCGALGSHGELDSRDAAAVRAVVARAVAAAAEHALPCVIAPERPWGGNVATVAGIGAARERWLSAWRELAAGHFGKIANVSTSEYRAAVLGRSYASAPRHVAQAAEAALARTLAGRDCGPDESAAIVQGRYASHAAAVGQLLGKRARRAMVAL